MKSKKWFIAGVLFCFVLTSAGQKPVVDDKKFFQDEEPVEMEVYVDVRNLMAQKLSLNFVYATIKCTFPDSKVVDGQVRIKPRGHFRKDNCRMSSMTFDFKNDDYPAFSKLGTLKMVAGCGFSEKDEQYVLKEYLVYKIYNLLTDLSFRVRLMHVKYNDTKGKVKPWSQYAFFIEDTDDMAKRNKCRKKEQVNYAHQYFNRAQASLVYLFEYMIGNTDWSMPYYHNIKVLVDKKDTTSYPYPVAFDFDMTGLVNPPYGEGNRELGLAKLTDRQYRGYPRSIGEIEATANIFLQKEEAIYSLIKNFNLLSNKYKTEMLNFLGEFFTEIKNKKRLKTICVDNALSN
jgi:hypothetical protein